MKTGFIILITLFLIKPHLVQAQTEAFIWLIGTWKSEKKDFYETWKPGPNSSFVGQSFKIDQGDTVIIEEMKIVRTNSLYYFLPGSNGQNENAPLLIRRFNMDAFFAENNESNATKKVSYQFVKNLMQKYQSDAGSRTVNHTFVKLE